jgi:quinol monooxygenase YgiN
MGSPAVAELLKVFESNPDFQVGPPRVISTQAELLFTRPAIAKAVDPLIVVAQLKYHPGKTPEVLAAWRRICAVMSLGEEGTLAQLVLKDSEDQNTLHLVEVFQDEEYLQNQHGKSAEFKQEIVKEEALRAGPPEAVFVRHIAGYLHK